MYYSVINHVSFTYGVSDEVTGLIGRTQQLSTAHCAKPPLRANGSLICRHSVTLMKQVGEGDEHPSLSQ